VGKDIELGTLGVHVRMHLDAIDEYTVFVDGPIVIHPVDLGGSTSTSLTALGASEADATSSDPPATARAWFKVNPERTASHGVEGSLLYLRDIIQRDRYDVSIFCAHVTPGRANHL
jgi:hypothetical protein